MSSSVPHSPPLFPRWESQQYEQSSQVLEHLGYRNARALYEDAAKSDRGAGLWDWVLDRLQLEPCYRSAVVSVLQEGRWRYKASPDQYIRRAALCAAARDGLRYAPALSELAWPAWMTYTQAEESLTNSYAVADDADDDAPPRPSIAMDGDMVTLLRARSRGVSRCRAAGELGWPEARVQRAWKRLQRAWKRLQRANNAPLESSR